MNNRRHIIRIVAFLIAIPSAAWANPGTPLFLASFYHLVFINLLIGLGEGLIIALIFKIRAGSAIGYMIAANYFSTLVGFVAFAPLIGLAHLILGSATIYNLWMLIWVYIAALYLLAVVLEWPFCLRAVKASRPSGSRILGISLLASFIAQSASYAVLIPYYERASVYHVYKDFTVDRSLSFTKPATVYFLRDDGIYKVKTDGSGLKKVLNSAMGSYDRFEVDPASTEYLKLSLGQVTLSDHFARISASNPGWGLGGRPWVGRWSTLDLRSDRHSNWRVEARYSSLLVRSQATDLKVALSLPFFEWKARSATMLPGDQVVAELSGQIVILDVKSRKMGLIAMGRNPVATPSDDKLIDADIQKAIHALDKEVGDDTKGIRREAAP